MSDPFHLAQEELRAYCLGSPSKSYPLVALKESLAESWKQSPHSAMEMLLYATKVLLLPHANEVVRYAVNNWKVNRDYHWAAGGSADHCYLAALAMSANSDLADPELVNEKRVSVLRVYGTIDHTYGEHDVPDAEAKTRLLTEWLQEGRKIELDAILTDREFSNSCILLAPDFGEINAELVSFFSKNPERLQELNWRTFEELLDAIFRNQGYTTELGPGRGDGGVDLRLIHKDSIGTMLTLVQAKRYKASIPIDLQAVQALYGVVDDQKAHRGLFVTTSRYLPGAQSFADRQEGRLILADSSNVANWCAQALPSMRKR